MDRELELGLMDRAASIVVDLYKVLKWLEWGASYDQECCPICDSMADDGHAIGCQLAAALAKAEGRTG